MAMLIQLMNAIKRLKRISRKLNNSAFGASIGMHLPCLVQLLAREIIIFVFNSFFLICWKIISFPPQNRANLKRIIDSLFVLNVITSTNKY